MEFILANWQLIAFVAFVVILWLLKEVSMEIDHNRSYRSRLRKAFRRVRNKAKEKVKKNLTNPK